MKKSDDSPDIEDVTSDIVRIAYRQSREIAGSENSEETEANLRNKDGFACTQRLTSLPIVTSLNTRISEAYASVKGSNSAVECILNKTEEGFTEGAKIVAPVTTKICESLEEPLKTIDNAVCHGLDYLEDNVPSVKLPPTEIYENLEGYVRNVSDNAKKYSTELYTSVKHKIDKIAKVVQAEMESKSDESDDNAKPPKSDDSR